ncbi:MAG: response regulator [Betaproteobacteria bacterium]
MPFERLNILMVDDQPAKLFTYEIMLAELDENLIKAHTAREALAYLLKDEIAVVLMDVNMPEFDGFELAELIRQHPRCNRTAIIFVSAVHVSDRDRVRGYQTGAVDYVSVPVVPEILRAKLRVFIDLHRKTTELERLNRTLEDRVSARTSALQESISQLRVSEKRLRLQGEALAEADRRKNEFLAMLAHELRNPLQPIRTAIEVLRRPDTAQAQRDWGRDVIHRQVNQLVRLVDDLLDASRITSGKLTLRRETIEVSQVITAAVEATRPFAEQKRIEIAISLPSSTVHVDGDSVRLTQVFLNLLNNAVKFTGAGGNVAMSVEPVASEVLVRVSDDGAGISATDLAHVFDTFYQGKTSMDEIQGGLGLGLALVRQLVELHGGSVTAHSAGAGRGSEFCVRLPALSAGALAQDTSGAQPVPLPPARPRRILVVDDNRDAAESLALMLRLVGNEVETVFNGTGAVSAMREFEPDIVLMDLGMPELDGYQAARAIRMNPRGDEVVLIAITGWGSETDRKKSQDAGFDQHLVKPVVPTDLLALLSSLDAAVSSPLRLQLPVETMPADRPSASARRTRAHAAKGENWPQPASGDPTGSQGK